MLPTPDLAHQPLCRIVVLVGDALLEGDDGVVGDVDVDWADLCAALGDVAEPEAVVLLEVGQPVSLVHRVHLQPLVPDEEAWSCELGVLVVGPQDVADVLAHKALYALLRFVEALDILLVHGEGSLLAGLERLDALGHLVVPGDIGDQVLYDGEGPHRTYVYLSPLILLDARLTQQLGPAVYLGATRAAVGRGGHPPWIIAVAFAHAFAFASSTSDARCSGIGGISRRSMPTSPCSSFLTIKLILPSSSSGPSKSSLHWAPRRSLRSRAVLMMISEIWTR